VAGERATAEGEDKLQKERQPCVAHRKSPVPSPKHKQKTRWEGVSPIGASPLQPSRQRTVWSWKGGEKDCATPHADRSRELAVVGDEEHTTPGGYAREEHVWQGVDMQRKGRRRCREGKRTGKGGDSAASSLARGNGRQETQHGADVGARPATPALAPTHGRAHVRTRQCRYGGWWADGGTCWWSALGAGRRRARGSRGGSRSGKRRRQSGRAVEGVQDDEEGMVEVGDERGLGLREEPPKGGRRENGRTGLSGECRGWETGVTGTFNVCIWSVYVLEPPELIFTHA